MKLLFRPYIIFAILILVGCNNNQVGDATTPHMGLTRAEKYEFTENAISGDINSELGLLESSENNDDKTSEDFWTIITLLNNDDPNLLNLFRYKTGWDLLRANQFLNKGEAYCAVKLGLTLLKKIDMEKIESQNYKQYFGETVAKEEIKRKINDTENKLKYIKKQDCSKIDAQSLNAWLYKIRNQSGN